MPRHLQRELENLRKQIFSLGKIVEENVYKSVKSFTEKDTALAAEIIEMDREIDIMEIEVEEECLKILALHQPVAVDLRFIVAVLKLNNDLERIGDLAVKISERTIHLCNENTQDFPIDFSGMAEKVQQMLTKTLDALVNMDPELAYEVCAADDDIDILHRDTYEIVREEVKIHPEYNNFILDFLSVSGGLERIADHATNIAEDIIYMINGEIVRHHNVHQLK